MIPLLNLENLGRENILRCRLVCKSWKGAVDQLLENSSEDRSWSKTKLPGSYLKCFRLKHAIGTGLHILLPDDDEKLICRKEEMFQSHLSSKARARANPILGRRMTVTVPYNQTLEDDHKWLHQSLEGVVRFLGVYGEHLWHFGVTVKTAWSDAEELYEFLWDVLKLMPNLQTLEVDAEFGKCYHKKDVLHEFIELNPLPPLPHLRKVRVAFDEVLCCEVALLQAGIMVKYAPQLEKFQLPLDFWKHLYWQKMEHLTELSLEMDGISYSDEEGKWLSLTSDHSKPPGHLRKLSLDLYFRPLNVEYLFRFLEEFSGLVALQLNFGHKTHMLWPQDPDFMKLPSVSDLQLTFKGNPRMTTVGLKNILKLLECFPNLKYLSIQGFMDRAIGRMPQEIDLVEVQAWKLLPFLKEVEYVKGSLQRNSVCSSRADTADKTKMTGPN